MNDKTPSKYGARSFKHWTEEETTILKKLYGEKSATEIAGYLGRSVQSIRSRITSLNLRKEKPDKYQGEKKFCPTCKTYLPFDQYYKTNKGKTLYFQCRSCTSMTNKQNRHRAKEKEIEEMKKKYIEERQGKLFRCSGCRQDLPIDAFNIWKRPGSSWVEKRNYCCACNTEKGRKRRLEKERKNEYVKFTTKS